MKNTLTTIWLFLTKLVKSPQVWYFASLSLIFFANTLHESYPDEFDNISGGRFILRGVLPYSGFLSHHGPFAYYLAAFLNLFSGVSFTNFRLVYAGFLVIVLYGFYRLIKSRFQDGADFLRPYFILLGIVATYFWFHMLLADTLAAFMLILPFFYLIQLVLKNKILTFKDLWIVSLSLSFTLLTALTYIYFVAGLYFFLAIIYLKSGFKLFSKNTLKALGIIAAPYLIFLLTLILSGALSDYYFQNITYNQQYYIFNYPRADGQTGINPLRYAVVIGRTALDQIADGAKHVFSFNLYSVTDIPLLSMNLFLFLVLVLTGNYLALIPLIFMLLFSTPRSNIMTINETDYQSAVYTVLSIGNGCLLLIETLKRKVLKTQKDFLLGAITLIASAYMMIFAFAMVRPFLDKTYQKFMGTAPTIYNRPEIAPAVNLLVNKDEYAWIGPFEFEELYYLSAKFPSNYHWLLPANAKSEKIRQEMIADFEANKPKVIVFDKEFGAFGAPPSSFNYFMVDFIKSNYTLLNDLKDQQGTSYRCNIPKLKDFVCDGNFYLRNDVKAELLSKMVELNLAIASGSK
jgi:hypothetical protein